MTADSCTRRNRSRSPFASRAASSSQLRSKWFSIAFLLRPVTSRTSVRPASTASSTTYWIAGLSTTGSISLGVALVAGRKRVPSPATVTTALVTGRLGVVVRSLAMDQRLVGCLAVDRRHALRAGHVPLVAAGALGDVQRLVRRAHQGRRRLAVLR